MPTSSLCSDANKRPKIEPARFRQGSTSSSAATNGTNGSTSTRDSSSSSEQNMGTELLPNSRGSVNSMGGMPPMSDPMQTSPPSANFDFNGQRLSHGDGRQALPSLSDIMDEGRTPMMGSPTADGNLSTASGFVPANARRPAPDTPQFASSRVPLLHREGSSTDTNDSVGSGISTTSSATTFSRSSSDGLPIHALLTNRPMPSNSTHSQSTSPTFGSAPSPIDCSKSGSSQPTGLQGYG